ncbi:MAG: MaoC family dehydratase [Acidobacteriota bacterium]|nr:MaoC family dehydratase [Acidobacteriota bacterium]
MNEKLSLKRLKEMAGLEVGLSDWLTITQERIDAFAECTEDRQWIHVDPEKASRSPLGGTVAHGFLLLALLPNFGRGNPLFNMEFKMAVNYGLNRVRFIHPVHPGDRVRNRAVLKDFRKKGFRRILLTIENTLEIEGRTKPAMTAELLAMFVI